MCLDANSEQSGLLSVPTLALVRDFARQTMKFVFQVLSVQSLTIPSRWQLFSPFSEHDYAHW
jgi:hypothetical protein